MLNTHKKSHGDSPAEIGVAFDGDQLPHRFLFVLAGLILGVGSTVFPLHRANAQGRQSSPYQVFDLQNARIPRNEIRSGGPPVDGIPALTNPQFIRADQASYLHPNDRVIGVFLEGQAKAYPLRILNYHEAVNDRVGKVPVAVTYCPLCDSSVVYDRRVKGQELELGISGLLYNSNVLLYDRTQTRKKSLWSQVKTEAVSGSLVGMSLKTLPLEVTTWADWSSRHPQTEVLSPQTGHRRDYSRTPYGNYFQNTQLMFPVKPLDQRLAAKTPVLGIWSEKTSRAYPLASFEHFRERKQFQQELDGLAFTLEYNPEAKSLRVVRAERGLEWIYSFWFAWAAFHPNTEILNSSNP